LRELVPAALLLLMRLALLVVELVSRLLLLQLERAQPPAL
jgi:hypothetical protein